MSEHCQNLTADRDIGHYWERQFGILALKHGRSFTAHQWGKKDSTVAYSRDRAMPRGEQCKIWTLPDITIWSRPGEHHEIKHKAPTDTGFFGLEEYRFNALLWFARETGNNVFYTIHNHALNGGRDNRDNSQDHWLTANVLLLSESVSNSADGFSWVSGKRQQVRILYWPEDQWCKLIDLWRLLPAGGTL